MDTSNKLEPNILPETPKRAPESLDISISLYSPKPGYSQFMAKRHLARTVWLCGVSALGPKDGPSSGCLGLRIPG